MFHNTYIESVKQFTAPFVPSATASTPENSPTPRGLTKPSIIDYIVNVCTKENINIVNDLMNDENTEKHMNARSLLNSVLNCHFILFYNKIIKVQANSTTSYMPKGYDMNKQLI